jgi:hypothetical protein
VNFRRYVSETRGIATLQSCIGEHEIRSLRGLGWGVGSMRFPLHFMTTMVWSVVDRETLSFPRYRSTSAA